ncbi:hypothetical protein [Marinobacter sp.]|uniref:hypothetical protein n=1 Tax=Marinobacter sp. TaxID=50741 RepID=UPI003A8F4F42
MEPLRKWAIRLELYFRLRPVVLFQLCTLVWLLDFGGPGFAALMGAITSANLLVSGLSRRFDIAALRDVLAYMDQFPDCRFESVDLKQLVGEDLLRSIGGRSFSIGPNRPREEKWVQGQKVSEVALENTHVFVIKPELEKSMPNSPTAFPLRLGGYIFLLDAPSSLRGPGKFIFLHELGHISMAGNYYALRAQTGYLPFLLVTFYASCQLAPTTQAAPVLGMYTVLAYIFLKTASEVLSKMADGHHESQADFFAFLNLDESDRKSAASFLRQFPISDMKLEPGFDEVRRIYLANNCRLIESGKDWLEYHKISGDTPFYVWIALGATALLAFFMRPQDFDSVFTEMLVFLGTMVFFYATVWREKRLRQQVKVRLENRLL